MIGDELARLIKNGYGALGGARVRRIIQWLPSLPLGRQEVFA